MVKMSYEKIKDYIVVVPTKARERIDEIEIADKAKKCFTVAKDSVKKADDYISEPNVLDKLTLAFGSFFVGLGAGIITSRFKKHLGYLLAALSGIGLAYLLYKSFNHCGED